MRYKAIIFDLDGTIIDTNIIWKTAIEALIESKGVVVSKESRDKLDEKTKGLAIHQSCALIKSTFDLEHSVEELIQEKKDRASQLYLKGIPFIDGFLDFYKKVVANNLKLAIATNSECQTLSIVIEQLKLRNFFGDHIYNLKHVDNAGKPLPDLYLYAAKQIGIKPEDCIAIEDSTHGIKAAKAAGMFCIGINTANDKRSLYQSDMIIDSYSEIDLKDLLRK